MNVCDNILSRDILSTCDDVLIWYLFIMSIIVFFIATAVVILYRKYQKFIQKQKQIQQNLEDITMSTKNNENNIKRLLNLGEHGSQDVVNSSMDTLEQNVAFEITRQQSNEQLVQKFAQSKIQASKMAATIEEAEILVQSIDITNGHVDLAKLKLLSINTDTPLAILLLDKAQDNLNYIEHNQAVSLLKLISNDKEAIEILHESITDVKDDMSNVPKSVIDELIEHYSELETTPIHFEIVHNLAILLLKGTVKTLKRKSYSDLIKKMNNELREKGELKLNERGDKFREGQQAISSQSSEISSQSSEIIIEDDQSENDLPITATAENVNNESVESFIIDDHTLDLSSETCNDFDVNVNTQNVDTQTEDDLGINDNIFSTINTDELILIDAFNAEVTNDFEKIAQIRFKINEWRITVKQPINFIEIGKDRVKELKTTVNLVLNQDKSNNDAIRLREILDLILVKMS